MRSFLALASLATLTSIVSPAYAQLFSISTLEHNEIRFGQPATNTAHCFNGGGQTACLGVHPVYGSEVFYDVKANAEGYGLLRGSAFIYNSRPPGTPYDDQVQYSHMRAGFVAAFQDIWTIGGRPVGEFGFLQVAFSLTGYAQATSEAAAVPSMNLSNLTTGQFDAVVPTLPSTVVVSTNFYYGQPTTLQFSLRGSSFIQNRTGGYDQQQADVNLLNTATIQQIFVFDASGLAVDATFSTQSGSTYLGAMPVPELSTTAFFLIGLLSLFALRRRM